LSLCSSGSGGIVPLILKLGSACRWVVSCIAQEIQPPSPPYPFNKLAGLPEAVWTFRERQKNSCSSEGSCTVIMGRCWETGNRSTTGMLFCGRCARPRVRVCVRAHMYTCTESLYSRLLCNGINSEMY